MNNCTSRHVFSWRRCPQLAACIPDGWYIAIYRIRSGMQVRTFGRHLTEISPYLIFVAFLIIYIGHIVFAVIWIFFRLALVSHSSPLTFICVLVWLIFLALWCHIQTRDVILLLKCISLYISSLTVVLRSNYYLKKWCQVS